MGSLAFAVPLHVWLRNCLLELFVSAASGLRLAVSFGSNGFGGPSSSSRSGLEVSASFGSNYSADWAVFGSS